MLSTKNSVNVKIGHVLVQRIFSNTLFIYSVPFDCEWKCFVADRDEGAVGHMGWPF